MNNQQPNTLSNLPQMLLPKLSMRTHKPNEEYMNRALDIEWLVSAHKPEHWLPNRDRPAPRF